MQKWMVICILNTVIMSLSTSTSQAQTVTSKTDKADSTLNEIIVTALRLAEDANSVPYVTYKKDSSDNKSEKAIRTTPDVLKGTPSVMVQKTSYGQGSPIMRGFTGFRTLFMIDGIRLNNSVFRDGPNQYWNTVDSFSIDDYEVVMGPASVLYGSDAIGGTVNALPKMVPDFKGSPAWDNEIYYRGSTAERSNTERVRVAERISQDNGFHIGATRKDIGDLDGGKDVGRQVKTGYSETDFDGRWDYYMDKDSILTLVHQSTDQNDVWRTHRTIYGINWKGLKKGDDKVHLFDQNRDLTYVKLDANNIKGLCDNIEATISRHFQGEDQYRVKKDDTSEQQGFDVATYGTSVQLGNDFENNKLVYGAEFYRDNVDSYLRKYKANGSLSKTEIQGPVADDATYDSIGVYVEDTISSINKYLDIIPGVRYSYARADAEKVKDPLTGKKTTLQQDWDHVVGSLRMLYALTADRNHVIFVGASQGFRAPNLSDLTRLDTARSTEIETPVSNLDPEKYLEYEIGFKSHISDLTASITYYFTDIDSMIVRTPTSRIIDDLSEVTKKNSGNGYVNGIEFSSDYTLTSHLSLWLSASWMDGKVDAYPTSSAVKERDYMTRLMPLTAETGIRWQMNEGQYWIELLCDMAEKADKLSADDKRDTQRIPTGGTPGYAVYTARSGIQISELVNLTFAVENILDQDYRIHGSGVNEAGRNFIAGLSCKF